jgi:hypothetical protein
MLPWARVLFYTDKKKELLPNEAALFVYSYDGIFILDQK